MALGIHPAQVEWLKQLDRGEKILWHSSMHILDCFALEPEFDPRRVEYCSLHVLPTHLHDLIYPLYNRDQGVMGIQFWCLGGLLQKTDLLSTQDEGGCLPPLAIYIFGAKAYEDSAEYKALPTEKKERIHAQDKEAILFLKRYPLLVPHSIWSLALPKPDS